MKLFFGTRESFDRDALNQSLNLRGSWGVACVDHNYRDWPKSPIFPRHETRRFVLFRKRHEGEQYCSHEKADRGWDQITYDNHHQFTRKKQCPAWSPGFWVWHSLPPAPNDQRSHNTAGILSARQHKLNTNRHSQWKARLGRSWNTPIWSSVQYVWDTSYIVPLTANEGDW